MRTNFSTLIKLSVFSLLAVSCNDDQELPVTVNEINLGENVSEIALLEEELGTTLYKRDFTLTDESGDNQVTLRVAAQEEDVLESYLKTVDFSITPVYINDYPVQRKSNKGTGLAVGESTQNFSGIITEFVNENLKNDVVGIRLNVEVTESTEASRMNYNFTTTHTSNNWPTFARFDTFANSTTIKYHFEAKQKALTSWYTGYLEVCKYNGTSGPDTTQCSHHWEQTPNNVNTFWVDGPYRTRAVVSYWNAGSYGVTFIR